MWRVSRGTVVEFFSIRFQGSGADRFSVQSLEKAKESIRFRRMSLPTLSIASFCVNGNEVHDTDFILYMHDGSYEVHHTNENIAHVDFLKVASIYVTSAKATLE